MSDLYWLTDEQMARLGLVTVLRRSPERLELAIGDRRDDQAHRRVQAGGGADCTNQRVTPRQGCIGFGIGKSTLGRWASQYRPSDLAAAPQADLARENERLRLENRVLREEREVLKSGPGLRPACAR